MGRYRRRMRDELLCAIDPMREGRKRGELEEILVSVIDAVPDEKLIQIADIIASVLPKPRKVSRREQEPVEPVEQDEEAVSVE